MINPSTGQPIVIGTAEYDAVMAANADWNRQAGWSVEQIKAAQDPTSPTYGAVALNNPVVQAYSSAFAEHNTGGGGLQWVQDVGGVAGFEKAMLGSGVNVNPATNSQAVSVTAPTVQTPTYVGAGVAPIGVVESPNSNAANNSILGWAIIAAGAFVAYKVLKHG